MSGNLGIPHKDRLSDEERKKRRQESLARYAAAHPGLAIKRAREWQVANKERFNANQRRRYAEDFAKKSGPVFDREWRKMEKIKAARGPKPPPADHAETRRKWLRANWGRHLSYHRLRNIHKTKAKPKWASDEKIFSIYAEAQRRSKETGVRHDVDHIIPLTHKLVCGLHVENNLQILTRTENAKKNNKFQIQEHLPLF